MNPETVASYASHVSYFFSDARYGHKSDDELRTTARTLFGNYPGQIGTPQVEKVIEHGEPGRRVSVWHW